MAHETWETGGWRLLKEGSNYAYGKRSPLVLRAAARDLGLGSWIGRGSKKFLHPAIAYSILSFIQFLNAQ